MKLTERLRPALLRWDRLLAVAALALPFVAAMLAGFAWMIEHGWLIEFIVASISLGGLVALIRLVRLWMRGRETGAAPRPEQLHARVDPTWGEREIGAFEAAQIFIAETTAQPLPWEDLQPIAQEVVRRVAAASGKGDKGVLDFTIPEANNGSFYGADAGTGFIGAIIAGLLVGYFVKWITSFNYHKFVQPLVPIMIAPITGSLFIAGLFIFVIGAPIAGLMDALTALLTSMSTGNVVLLGIVLGGMAGFDMGGPFNKVAFLFSVGMIASGQTQFMGAMACAIPVAPLGMAIATRLGRRFDLFESSEIEAGKAAGAMGLVGISEGAIPFAAQDPMSVIPANVLGSMVAAVMAFSFGITNSVAHGGPVVALLGAMNHPVLALICMAAGAVVTAVTCVTLKKVRKAKMMQAAA